MRECLDDSVLKNIDAVFVSKANHNKRICGHDKHNDTISSYLCVDAMSEGERREKRVTFSSTRSVPIGICNLFFFHTYAFSPFLIIHV